MKTASCKRLFFSEIVFENVQFKKKCVYVQTAPKPAEVGEKTPSEVFTDSLCFMSMVFIFQTSIQSIKASVSAGRKNFWFLWDFVKSGARLHQARRFRI